jgi:hypothetical protein
MSYCTIAEVKVYAGSTITDADLLDMITDADRKINLYFKNRRVAVDPDTATTASVLFVRSAISERFHLTGENPTAYSCGEYSQQGAANQLELANSLKKEAYGIIDDYIRGARPSVKVRRVRT